MSLEQHLVLCKSKKTSRWNICENCRRNIILCPWLHEGKPVPGWTAEKSTVLCGNGKREARRKEPTYHILECPLQIEYPKERFKQDGTDRKDYARTFYD